MWIRLQRGALVSVALTLLGFPSAIGADENLNYTAFGIGLKSCGSYTEARKSDVELRFVDWLAGYFTALNRVTLHTHNLIGNTDFDGATGWLDNYCKDHPTERFGGAADSLRLFLLADGEREGPKSRKPR
jgi:hypothetical protein